MPIQFPSQNPAGLTVNQLFGQHPNVQSWGAKGDVGEAGDGNIAVGSNIFSSNAASFGVDPYGNLINEIGKSICIAGAGTGPSWPTVQVNTFGSPSNYNVSGGNENWANILGPIRSQGSNISLVFNVANCGDPGLGPGNECAWLIVGTNTATNLVGNNASFTGLTIVHGATITGTGGTSGSFLVLTVPVGHGLVAGQKVRVFNNSAANGIWRVIAATSTTITLPILYSGGGSVAGGQVAPVLRWQSGETRVLTPGTTFAYYSVFVMSAIPTVGGVTGKPTSLNVSILGNGNCLFGHIVSVTDQHHVVLDVTATHTVGADVTYPYYTGQRWYYGTDDTTAIETAIASMPTTKAPYGTLFFPAAQYLISRQIFVPQYCRIQGANNMNTRMLANVGNFTFNIDPVGKGFIGLGSFGAGAVSGFFINGPAVAARIEDMIIDCNDTPGMGAIWAGNIQETSGVFRCLITAWQTFGLSCGDGTFTAPYQNQNWSLQDLWIFPSLIAIQPRGVVIAPSFPPPLHAPTLTTASTGGTNPFGATLYVTYTYLGPNYESSASLESSILVPANGRLLVASPPSATGCTGWNCYVSTVSGAGVSQAPTNIAIGTGGSFNSILSGGTAIGPGHWFAGTFAMTVDTSAGIALATNYAGNCVRQQGSLTGNRGQELVTVTAAGATSLTAAYARTHDIGEQIISTIQPTACGIYFSISANPILRLTAIGGSGFGWGCGLYAGASTLTVIGLHIEASNAGFNLDAGTTASIIHMTGNFNTFDCIRLPNASAGCTLTDVRLEGGANILTDLAGPISYTDTYFATYTRDDTSPTRHTIYGANPLLDIEQWTAHAFNFGQPGCCIGSRSEFRTMSWPNETLPNYSPNNIALNTVGFSSPTQGGILSVNSRYVGQNGAWEQTTANAYNQSLYLTLGASRFAVSFGPAVLPAGTYDPQTSLAVDREFRVDLLMGTRFGRWNFGDDSVGDYEGVIPSVLIGNQVSSSAFKIQQTYFSGSLLQILGNASWPGGIWNIGLQIDSLGNLSTKNLLSATTGQLLKYGGSGIDKATTPDVMKVLFGGSVPAAGAVTFNGTVLVSGAAAVLAPTTYNEPVFWTGLGGTWGYYSPGTLVSFLAQANTINPGDILTRDSTSYSLKTATAAQVVTAGAGSNVLAGSKLLTIDGSGQLLSATGAQVMTAASGSNVHTAGIVLTTDSSGNLKDATGAQVMAAAAGPNTLVTAKILTTDSSGNLIDATGAQMFNAMSSGVITPNMTLAYTGSSIISSGEFLPTYTGITIALAKLTTGGTNGSIPFDIHGRAINNSYIAPT